MAAMVQKNLPRPLDMCAAYGSMSDPANITPTKMLGLAMGGLFEDYLLSEPDHSTSFEPSVKIEELTANVRASIQASGARFDSNSYGNNNQGSSIPEQNRVRNSKRTSSSTFASFSSSLAYVLSQQQQHQMQMQMDTQQSSSTSSTDITDESVFSSHGEEGHDAQPSDAFQTMNECIENDPSAGQRNICVEYLSNDANTINEAQLCQYNMPVVSARNHPTNIDLTRESFHNSSQIQHGQHRPSHAHHQNYSSLGSPSSPPLTSASLSDEGQQCSWRGNDPTSLLHRRQERNRIAARRSREKKKEYMQELENSSHALLCRNKELLKEIRKLKRENAQLKGVPFEVEDRNAKAGNGQKSSLFVANGTCNPTTGNGVVTRSVVHRS